MKYYYLFIFKIPNLNPEFRSQNPEEKHKIVLPNSDSCLLNSSVFNKQIAITCNMF